MQGLSRSLSGRQEIFQNELAEARENRQGWVFVRHSGFFRTWSERFLWLNGTTLKILTSSNLALTPEREYELQVLSVVQNI